MFQPARLKRAMVASCRLPLGIPSLSLLATSYLFLIAGLLVGRVHGFGKTTDRALVAYKSVAFDDDAKEQRIVVAVGGGGDDAQAVAAGFALHPQLLSGAAPEGDEAGLQGFCIADGVEKAQHQHLAGARILHNAGREAVHLVEIDCGVRIAHGFPCAWLNFTWERKKARGLNRRRASFLRSLWPITSGHSSPPAWRFHDDGGDRDGGGSASDLEVTGKPGVVSNLFLADGARQGRAHV